MKNLLPNLDRGELVWRRNSGKMPTIPLYCKVLCRDLTGELEWFGKPDRFRWELICEYSDIFEYCIIDQNDEPVDGYIDINKKPSGIAATNDLVTYLTGLSDLISNSNLILTMIESDINIEYNDVIYSAESPEQAKEIIDAITVLERADNTNI